MQKSIDLIPREVKVCGAVCGARWGKLISIVSDVSCIFQKTSRMFLFSMKPSCYNLNSTTQNRALGMN